MSQYKIIIPARLKSSRLEQKLLRKVGQFTVLEHSYHRAKESLASDIIIAADDLSIIDEANRFGAKAILTDKNHPSGTDRLAECVEKLALEEDDIIVNLQGDEPFMPAILIDLCASTLINQPNADISTLATPMNNEKEILNPNAVKVVCDQAGYAMYFSRAAIPFNRDKQTLNWQQHYFHHMGIYAYKVSFLRAYRSLTPCPMEHIEKLEQLRAIYHGYKIAVAITKQKPPKGIDTIDDFQEALRFYQNKA